MNFDLTEDQREIKRTARDWLAARYPIARVREIALDGAADDTWDEVAELGWPEIADFGMVELAVVAEELGSSLAPTPLASHWAARLLHPELDGRGTVAMSDPGESEPAASTMEGLKGTKIAVPVAAGADVFVVTTASGHFAVPASAASVEPARALDPTRPLFTVEFDGGGRGDRRGPLRQRLARDRGRRRGRVVGVASAVTRMSVEYAKEREQFGTDRLLPGRLPRLRADVPGDRGRPERRPVGRSALEHDPENASMAANCAKAYASDAAVNVCRSAMQVHGGIGFTWNTTCTCTSSAPKPTPAPSAIPPGTANRSPPSTSNGGSGRRRAAWWRRRPSGPRRRRAASPCPSA